MIKDVTLNDFEQMEKALCEASLLDFTRVFWSEIEGRPFVQNWHVEAICEHLQALTNLDIRKLVINGPPRCGKSGPASIMWQPWEWIHMPYNNWLTSAVSRDLAVEFNDKSRQIIKSEKYQRYWGNKYEILDGNDLKTKFRNSEAGQRLAVGTGSQFIGFGGDRKIVDDPQADPFAHTKMLQKIADWFFGRWRTRTNNPKTAVELVNMQRMGIYDLCAHIKEREGDKWTWLVLPSQFDPAKRYHTVLKWNEDKTIPIVTWEDPREKKGDLLFPQIQGPDEEKETRDSLLGNADAQMDQDPINTSGTFYNPDDIMFYKELTYNRETDIVLSSADCANKGKETSDFSAGVVAIKKGNNYFHLEGYAEKLEFGPLVKAHNKLLSRWTKRKLRFYKHLIEDAAMGPALMNILGKKFSRIEPVKAVKNKSVRMKSVIPVYNKKRVWFPLEGAVIIIDKGTEHEQRYEIDTAYTKEWIKQIKRVPASTNDDCPDTTAQLINAVEDIENGDIQYENDEFEGSINDLFFWID